MSRKFTCAILDLVDQGMFDKDQLIHELLMWMSEHDVAEFYSKNVEPTLQEMQELS